MKKLLGSNVAKWIALFLTTIMAILFGLSLATIVVQTELEREFHNEEAVKERIYQNMCYNYSLALTDNMTHGGALDLYSGGNLLYSVYKDDLLLYTTDVNVAKADYPYSYEYQEGGEFYYNVNSLFGVISKSDGYYEQVYKTYTAAVFGIIYDDASGLFYWNTTEGLYPMTGFYSVDWDYYTLNSANTAYVCEERADRFDYAKAKAEGTTIFVAGDVALNLADEENGYYPFLHAEDALGADGYLLAERVLEGKDDYWLLNRNEIAYRVGQKDASTYTILMKVVDNPAPSARFSCGSNDYFYTVGVLISAFYTWGNVALTLEIVSGLFLLLGFVFLMAAAGHRKNDDEIHTRLMDRCPLLIYFAAICTICGCGIGGNIVMMEYFDWFRLGTFVALELECLLLWILCGLAFCMSIAVRIKSHTFWRYTLCYYLLLPFISFHKWVHNVDTVGPDGRRFKWTIYGIWGGLTLLEGIVVAGFSEAEAVVMFVLFKCLVAVFLWFVLPQFIRVYTGGERVANGDYTRPIETRHMLPFLEAHAKHINAVQDGIAVAVEERMKSERFKTELITNVSHDIKTPLTSIINYVDLLQKENITNPTCVEYLEVLDRQSARLKKLIEDLMEASKASTGNLEVHKERIHVGMIAGQLVGEYEEKAKAADLELILSKPEEDIYAQLDGRHIFRVLDNIMNNAMKYAQPGTRVYVNLEADHGLARLSFRNTSKYPLNISAEELMERFTRGDSSRHTEGSGLGLNIAKSLTELMDGTFFLYVDGDLFKVVVEFPIDTLGE